MQFLLSILRFALKAMRWTIFFVLVAFFLQRCTYPLGLPWNAVAVLVSEHQFDYVGWELNALATKTAQTLFGAHPYMDEATRTQYVRDYFTDLAEARRIDTAIEQAYIDPAIPDPDEYSIDLRANRDLLREDLRNRQPLMEAILEGQVAAVLVDEGFGVLGQLIPPISMHFTQVPNLLIVSPRDEIRFDISINVNPLTVDEKETLEQRIDTERDVSSLIVPLGGIALYPAMILETSSLQWAVETFAHEWSHHYLFFYPIGLQYDFSGEARIINETVADVFGKEIGRKVLERYYPDLVPPLPVETGEPTEASPLDPNAFNFGAEMHETRVTVDELLAAGEVEAAEIYMGQRQQFFFENGYHIRKLNQAFFAFYGGYQAGNIAGVGGADPIGEAVRDIRENSASVHDFIMHVRGLTSRQGLLDLRDTLTTP